MKPWLSTPFDYEIYQGQIAPACEHCKEPLDTVVKTSTDYLHWDNEEKEYLEEESAGFEYSCMKCGGTIKNIGMNGVLIYYRQKKSAGR